jgi:hypothetical protein
MEWLLIGWWQSGWHELSLSAQDQSYQGKEVLDLLIIIIFGEPMIRAGLIYPPCIRTIISMYIRSLLMSIHVLVESSQSTC